MLNKKKEDLLGIDKKFKVEFLESSSYKESRIGLEDGEIIPSVITGTLVNYTNAGIGHIYIMDEDDGVNIIPFSRIVSMIHLKEPEKIIVKGGYGGKEMIYEK